MTEFDVALDVAFDVIVVGAGAAGLYTALCLPPSLRVALITKHNLSLSASDWAQGGVAAVVDPEDSTALHIADTLQAGAGLCDDRAVKFLIENARACIDHLVDMGVAFDRHQGQLAMTLEAAHSRRRVLHAADTTGRAITTTLVEQVLTRPNIQVLAPALVLDVWLDESKLDGSKCCQGVCLAYDDRVFWQRAGAVILATGGGGQVFAQTTNPVISTGDGVAIAHRAGAVLRDLEFVQFHPTALTLPGAPRFLISEAVRGEGAHLVDDAGHRFTFDYDPAGELAPRDVVSRAIFSHLQVSHIQKPGSTSHVWLDLRPIPAATIRHRFPNIIQVCQQWGIDVFTAPIPVAPAAHYWMGGVDADRHNATSIPQLYAVGETASTGVHGANRLASNSLLECLVFGAQFAAMKVSHPAPIGLTPPPIAAPAFELIAEDCVWIDQVRLDLPKLVWQAAGICREAATLDEAIGQVSVWIEQFNRLSSASSTPIKFAQLANWAELRNLLDVSQMLLKSAQYRTESRGGHYRSDYPTTLTSWQVHTMIQADRWYQGEVNAS